MSSAKAHKQNPHGIKIEESLEGPRTVQAAKLVNMALVSYTDDQNQKRVQLAIVGENNIHMIEGKALGFSTTTTPQGPASDWLKEAIFEALGQKEQ